MNNKLLFNQDNLLKNPLILPFNKTKLNSIVVQFNYNDVIKDKNLLIPVYKTLMLLTGQNPKIIRAKDSIAAFRVRKNMEIGAKVTINCKNNINQILNLLIVNYPKINIENYNLSLKSFELFYPIDQRIGANITLIIKSSTSISKQFLLSNLLLFK